jgi:hypothetical protein
MKKQYLTAVLTLICFLGLGVGAQAESNNEVVTNIPFEFVVGGVTLSAGTYSVSRVSSALDSHLVIRRGEYGMFLFPIAFDGASTEGALLTFEHVGNKYFLSKVKTPAGVYTIGTSRALTMDAQKKAHEGMFSSGTN